MPLPLTEEERTSLRNPALAIADALSALSPSIVETASFFDGASGVGLALSAASRWDEARAAGYRASSEGWLSRAQDLAGADLRPTLSGVVGVDWALSAVVHEPCDPELVEGLIDLYASPKEAHFDLLAGISGVGMYGLYAASDAGDRLAGHVVERLGSLSRGDARHASWPTRVDLLPDAVMRQGARDGAIDLGMAHGCAGVITFLSRAVHQGVERGMASELLARAVEALLLNRPAVASAGFPSAVSDGSPGERWASRTAWCYGDAGVGFALLRAARAAGKAEWEAVALEALRRVASRSLAEMFVTDCGLCHGAFGLAHVLVRTWQATGDDFFLRAALRLVDEGLAFRMEGGIAGFSALLPTGEIVADPSLLTGAAGLALALGSAAADDTFPWDYLLGTSLDGELAPCDPSRV